MIFGSPAGTDISVSPRLPPVTVTAPSVIKEPIADMGIEFEDEDTTVMRIMDMSSCHPNIVQYICQQLIRTINTRGSRVIRLADLVEVAQSGTFSEYFMEVTWGNATAMEKVISLLMVDQQVMTLGQLNESLKQLDIQATPRQLGEAMRGLSLYSITHKELPGYVFDNLMFPKLAQTHLAVSASLAGLAEEWRQAQAASSLTPA